MTTTSAPADLEAFAPPAAAFLGDALSTAKATRSAGHRIRNVTQTSRIAEDRLRPLGITRIADITGLDVLGIPVFNSVRPAAAEGNLTVTSGKGLTRQASRVSAMMEAIERYYGERQGRFGTVAALNEVRQHQLAVDPRLLILDRDAAFDPAMPIEWVAARELTRDRVVQVPANSVFVPYDGEPRLFASSSNGLASGNSLAEATLHALLEVIERDATAFGEITGTGFQVPFDGLPPAALTIIEAMRAAGIDVTLRSLDSDFGLPTFHVTIDDAESCDAMLINGGFGCHLDPAVAVCRALTEAAQSRLSVISGAREDLVEHEHLRRMGYATVRAKVASWFSEAPERSFDKIPDLSHPTVAEDLALVLSRLAQAGMRLVFACDLASAEPDLAVVRVIVPGLEVAHTQPQRIGSRLARVLNAR